jgi:hypothetical protein
MRKRRRWRREKSARNLYQLVRNITLETENSSGKNNEFICKLLRVHVNGRSTNMSVGD